MTAIAAVPLTIAEDWHTIARKRMFARRWPTEPGGPTVVLVHGFVVSGAYFVPTGEHLAGMFDVLAPDLPGFGRSGQPDDVPTVPALAGTLAEWMAAAGIDRAALVANSFGCQVAAELAMRRPELVSSIVLASPTMDPTARTTSGQLWRWRQEAKMHSAALRRLLVCDFAAAGLRRTLGTFRHALADGIEDKLPYVTAPTLVVRGTADPIVTDAWATEVARLVPDGRLAMLPDAPHAMNFESPDRFAAAIKPFLTDAARRLAVG